MKICVLIPTYNEKENIEELIKKIFEINKKITILVIDDNSPDGTGEIVNNLRKKYPNLNILHRRRKEGIGSAYIQGFKYVIETMPKIEYLISMDADLSHDPKLIPIFLENTNHYDLIIGSRYIKGGDFKNWPKYRKIISRGANIYGQFLLGIKVKDISSGYRCYKKDILKKIDLTKIKNKGYVFLEEILYLCVKKGARVKEIPLVFVDRTKGRSKLNKKEMIKFFLEIPKFRFRFIKI